MTDIEKEIMNYLNTQNIDCALCGYLYLTTAINYVTIHPDATRSEFIAYTAEHHSASFGSVSGNICYALRNSDASTKRFVKNAANVIRMSAPARKMLK